MKISVIHTTTRLENIQGKYEKLQWKHANHLPVFYFCLHARDTKLLGKKLEHPEGPNSQNSQQ